MKTVTDNVMHGTAAVSNYTETEGILGSEGLRISQVAYVKSYMHKRIRGVGEVQLQYSYRGNGEIEFSGFELFSGAIDDRTGSVIFALSGTVLSENKAITVNQILKRGSGSAELYSCSGEGSYVVARDGHCSFEFTLST